MYNYATRRADTKTRMAGLFTSVAIIGGLGIAIATWKYAVAPEEEKAEVAIIDVEEEIVEEPPPPPPVDVDLPPPPPMVVIPEFVFDAPPPPAAIQQVAAAVDRPAPPPAPPAAKPAPPPPPALPPVRPKADPNRFSKLMAEDYPSSALRKKQEGDVTLSMCMSVDGKASNVEVVKSSGVEALDEAAVKGVPKLRFTPAKDSQGKPVAWCPPTYPPYTMTLSWKLPE